MASVEICDKYHCLLPDRIQCGAAFCDLSVFAGTENILIDNVAMLLGMCMFIVMNFFGQKIFVFRKIGHKKKNS